MSQETDPARIGPTATRRQAALASVIREHQQAVGNYLIQLVGAPDVALALTEETFVCAYSAHAESQPSAPLRKWLYRRATQLALRQLRRRPFIALPGRPDERAIVEAVLRQLPPRDRAALLLRDMLQFPDEEAATIMGTSVDGLQQRLERARARFRCAYLSYHALAASRDNGHTRVDSD